MAIGGKVTARARTRSGGRASLAGPRWGALALGLAGACAACGGTAPAPAGGAGGSGGGEVDAGPGAHQVCGDLAKAVCRHRDACTNNLANLLDYGTEASCEARRAASCVATLGAPGSAATPSSIELCAQAYPGETCVELLDGNPTEACVPPPGALERGASCAFDAQCASGFCAVSASAVCGTCQRLPRAGDPCHERADCGRDLACPPVAGGKASRCTAYVALAGACDAMHPCEAGLSCVGAAKGVMGACVASADLAGVACDATGLTAPDCAGDLGLRCLVGTCQNETLVAALEPCGLTAPGSFAVCKAGSQCVQEKATGPGTCVAPSPTGRRCDAVKGPPCELPARCVPVAHGGSVGVCTAPDPARCK